MNRIQQLFADKKENLLSVFYTAGYPELNDTLRIAEALEKAGADLIEIGIPFSDPIADGPVIQAASKTALDNGMNVGRLLRQVAEVRSKVRIPIILMGYVNPVLQYGMDKFCSEAAAAGADGLILPDLPLDVYTAKYKEIVEAAGLVNIFLITPTTSEARIRKIDEVSSGFIYAVSASSTTGAKTGFGAEQIQYFERLRSLKLRNPLLIGFGISGHDTFSQAGQYAAGAIVGSAYINMLRDSADIAADTSRFVSVLRGKS